MTEEKQSKRRGCLFYGLITVGLVFIGVLAGVYFGTRKAVRFAIEMYTTNAPTTIPTLKIPIGQQRNMAASLLQQFEAGANGRGPNELVIGEQELNVLIAQAPDLKAYQRHVYLEPQGNELKAYISLPLDQFKPWREFAYKMGGTNYSGRYMNGIAYANLVVTNAMLKVEPRKMVVAAKTLPDQFLKQFPWDTLTQPINDNTEFRGALQRVERIHVQDSKVHLEFKK